MFVDNYRCAATTVLLLKLSLGGNFRLATSHLASTPNHAPRHLADRQRKEEHQMDESLQLQHL
jgi:hypothetical protein